MVVTLMRMHIMKRYILILTSFLLMSCVVNLEDMPELAAELSHTEFTAAIANESAAVKTSLTEDMAVIWDKDDMVAVFAGVDAKTKFKVIEGFGTEEAILGVAAEAGPGGQSIFRNVAVYPYSESLKYENGIIEATLPEVQYYGDSGFGAGANLMVAHTATETESDLSFRNVLGALRLKITGDKEISSILMRSLYSEKITGPSQITLSDTPQIQMLDFNYDSQAGLTLKCETPVKLSQDKATEFWFMIPPGTYGGFIFSIYCSDGSYMQKTVSGKEITIARSGVKTMTEFRFEETSDIDQDRNALVEFYKAANGDQWLNNTNWCTDAPLETWYGVSVNQEGRCIILSLASNNLSGYISPEIGNLSELQYLDLAMNYGLWGTELPTDMGRLSKLYCIRLFDCGFIGNLPEGITELELFDTSWSAIVEGNNLNLEGVDLYAFKGDVTGIDGQSFNLAEFYASNKYTIIYQWMISYDVYTDLLKDIYERYKDHGVDVVGSFWYDGYDYNEYVEYKEIPWKNFNDGTNISSLVPTFAIVDSQGKVVWHLNFYVDKEREINTPEAFFVKELGLCGVQTYYGSQDYSADGKVQVLQSATEGNGIDVVILGDAYNDLQVAAGDFDRDAAYACEQLFAVEPYKSFRHLFNVYSVTAVSKHGDYHYGGDTAFGANFADGTLVYGYDQICMHYAMYAISEKRMNEAMIIVLMNSPKYAGTC